MRNALTSRLAPAVRFFWCAVMKVWESHAPVADRFAGCLLGLAVGDAVGAPYEGLTHADIFFQFGTPDKLITNPSGDTLYYTDDTEMMIGVRWRGEKPSASGGSITPTTPK